MVKTTEPYEDYFENVVKPKVLKGEEDTLDKKWKRLVPTAYREIIKEQQDRIDKAVEIYKNKNTCKYKKERFIEDKSTSDLMYEALTGGDDNE